MNAIVQEGVRQGERVEYLPAGSVLRPLRDQILVKPENWTPSSVIEVAGYNGRPLRGTVVAVGPGQWYRKREKNSRGETIRLTHTGRRIPCDVKVGDLVELGGLEMRGYPFDRIVIGTETFVMCQEADVCGIVER